MNTNPDQLQSTPAAPERLGHSKALVPTLAVLAVAVVALTATLFVTRSPSGGTPADERFLASQTSGAAPETTAPAQRLAAAPAPVQKPAPVQAKPRPAPTQNMGAAPVCQTCGTVDSITTVQRQGQVNGIGGTQITPGTVAGGVIGGLLGNQVGGGSGRTAATVLGAAGGAYAGNQIEKNYKKVTVYQVHVRMDDGSRRTIEQSSAPAPGSRVVIENGHLRPA